MKPIKEIAGELLLYFYTKQRKHGFPVMEIIRFDGWDKITMNDQSELGKDLMKICKDNAADLYNALLYLEQNAFLDVNTGRDSGGDSMHNFAVTSRGIDIIEAIERGQPERNNFYVTFNIKLADNVNVESLIKNELGSIFKASLL